MRDALRTLCKKRKECGTLKSKINGKPEINFYVRSAIIRPHDASRPTIQRV